LQRDQATRSTVGHSGLLVLFAAAVFAGDVVAALFFTALFLAGAFFTALFLAGAFFAALFLAVAFLAVAFFAGAFLAAFFRVDGPAARRSANSSEARSTVRESTSSPRRNEA